MYAPLEYIQNQCDILSIRLNQELFYCQPEVQIPLSFLTILAKH